MMRYVGFLNRNLPTILGVAGVAFLFALTSCDFSPKPSSKTPSKAEPKEDFSVVIENIIENFYKTITIGCDDKFNSCKLSKAILEETMKKTLEGTPYVAVSKDDDDIDVFSFFSFVYELDDFKSIREHDFLMPSRHSMFSRSTGPEDELIKMAARRGKLMVNMQNFMREQHLIIKKGKGLSSVKTQIREQKKYSIIASAVLELKNGTTHTETFYFVKEDAWKMIPKKIEMTTEFLLGNH